MLKAAQAGRRALEEQQAALVSGLHTLQRLLAKKGASSSSRSSSGNSNTISAGTGCGRESGSQPVDGAMAALSALLGSLQSDAVAGSQGVVSPQLSVGGGTLGEAAGSAEEVAAAGEQSDPLDITVLLPEGPDEGVNNGVESSAPVLPLGSGQAGSVPLAAPKSSSSNSSAGASPGRLTNSGRTSSSASLEAAAGGIAADQRQKQDVAVVALRASSSSTSSQSRIPAAAPPTKAGVCAPQTCTPGGGSPGKGRLRKLVLGLQGPCGRQGPGARGWRFRTCVGCGVPRGTYASIFYGLRARATLVRPSCVRSLQQQALDARRVMVCRAVCALSVCTSV